MRTPYGVECKYFYGNYYRGRKQEECRLIGNSTLPNKWSPDLCRTCPVPEILMANACPNLVLEATIKSGLLGIKKKVEVIAYCTKSKQFVPEPKVGCGQCHPLPPIVFDKEP